MPAQLPPTGRLSPDALAIDVIEAQGLADSATVTAVNDTANQQRERRDAQREADRIRNLLQQHGGREYDPSLEDEHYEGGFEIHVGKRGGPHTVGGFIIDPFRVWPPKMRQHAETLTAHGYHVTVREYFDGEILEVTPPARQPRAAWLRRLFQGPGRPTR
ncbi:MAG TPA: hypothetical protein VFG33_13740 [Kribbella sp.]|uniref:hypothetical protein n=1 Tax=Kribbella sp. TaxID=1871183 RepID=UPI002D78D1C9|nr:hypothetical protein [Kribbella sp.]HET6294440.1 hypothetical protein [Kribbella sp.]